jgi:hypothetical protein
MSWVAILAVIALILLAVLGHGPWHSAEIAFFDLLTNLFTGGHATG